MASGSANSCTVDPELEQQQQEQVLTIEDLPNQTPDYDFVDQPDQDYYCPVSLELLTQPHQTTCCGNHISQQAADTLIRERKPCPLCKEEKFNIQNDKYFTRKVRQLKVYCPNKKSGCEWTGELGDLDQHTTSCPKRPWKCPYCPFQSTHHIRTIDHTSQCDYQPVPCPNHCQVDTVLRCDVEKHLLTCPLQLVDCQFASVGCDVRVPRKDLAGHMTDNAQHHLMTATLLNLQLTRDLYQKMEEKDKQFTELKEELKAEIDIKRNDLHTKLLQQTRDLNTKLKQQTRDLNTKLQQQTCDLNTKLQQQTRDLDTKLQQQTRDLDTKLQQQTCDLDTKLQQQTCDLDTKLQQQMRDLDTKLQQQTRDLDTKLQQATGDLDTKLTQNIDTKHKEHMQLALKLSTSTVHTFTLTEFTTHKADGGLASWYSDPFYTYPGGYKFQLNIDTNGHGPARGTHITAYLCLRKGENHKKLHWPIKLKVTLDMLNQENNDHYSVTEVMSSTGDTYICIGSTYKFYPLTQLQQNHYLKNDALNFRLWLTEIL